MHRSVFQADGSSHSIQSSGPLVGHPSIHTDLVPTFTENLIGKPILANKALGIIHNDKMVLFQTHPSVQKLVNIAIPNRII